MSAQALLTDYVNSLSVRLAGVTTEGAEAQLADLVPNLLRGLAREQGRLGVDLRGQAHEKAIGVPDFSVKDGMLLIGHVETKAPGVGANPTTFRNAHDRDQWERYKLLPNVLYTDGVQWGLYRSGSRSGPLLKLTMPAAGRTLSEALSSEAAALAALVSQLFAWKAVPPASLVGLAEALAPLCRILRDEIRAHLDDHDSQVWRASDEFRTALFPERSDDQVADAFAQVCAYSMLLARSRGATDLSAHHIEQTLRAGHAVLARVVRVLLDEETEAEIGWALDTVRNLIEVVDFDRLRGGVPLPGMTSHDQTWLYFYEAFLAAYDPKLRAEYGVYYTPQSVIGAQVNLLDELLRTELGKQNGLASPGVTVLDPAVGTGSYVLRIAERAATAAQQELGPAAVQSALNGLARNLYAFEILVGPYAVAHLRLAELFADLGATLPEGGVQVYLTDTLSSPHAEPTTLARLLEPLVEEQRRALTVKDETEILVCLGNPPYERRAATGSEGEQHGGWVVHGDEAADPPLFETFLAPARANTIFSHVASLYNEYVYFWRWALWKVFEAPNAGGKGSVRPGLVSFISASSYLAGPGFVGMREHLRRICDEIWIIDLGGEGRGTRREENVFAIQTPVAICIALRRASANDDVPATAHYARITGTREEKLEQLSGITSLDDLSWKETATGWMDPLRPSGSEAWTSWPALIDLFPWQIPGVKAGRTWPIAPLRETLGERWRKLAETVEPEERARYFFNPRFGRRTDTAVDAQTLPPPASATKINDLTPEDPEPLYAPYAYRPFDRQWVVADPRVLALQRPPLWYCHSETQTYMAGFFTGILGRGPAVIGAAHIPDLHVFRGSFGGKDVVPLYRDPDGTPNVTAGVLDSLEGRLALPVTAEELFAYAFGLLSTPAYVERFWDELGTPGLRLPITLDPDLFRAVVEAGQEAIHLHTMGARKTPGGDSIAIASGAARLVHAAEEMPEDFSFDPATETLHIGAAAIAPVSEAIWAYEVSGYPVVSGWLRQRLRDPSGRARSSTSPLDAIRPTTWPHEYTVELLNLIWVLERILESNERQQALLDAVCAGPTLSAAELPEAAASEREHPQLPRTTRSRRRVNEDQTTLDGT